MKLATFSRSATKEAGENITETAVEPKTAATESGATESGATVLDSICATHVIRLALFLI